MTQSNDFSNKSCFVAGILQLLCGSFGIGRFYLGYKTYAVLQIVVTLISFGIVGAIWGFIDGIMILKGNVRYDNYGKKLFDAENNETGEFE